MRDIRENFEIISTLMDYREEDWMILRDEAGQIARWSPDLVKVFYDTLYGYDKTRAVFREGERPKVEKTLAEWFLTLAAGTKEMDFWEHQWVIALLHIKREVRNIYVLGMMNRMQQILLEKCLQTYDDHRKAVNVYQALLRITGVIAALIAECYTELQEDITEEGLSMAGLNPGLIRRIRENQINKMLAAIQRSE